MGEYDLCLTSGLLVLNSCCTEHWLTLWFIVANIAVFSCLVQFLVARSRQRYLVIHSSY